MIVEMIWSTDTARVNYPLCYLYVKSEKLDWLQLNSEHYLFSSDKISTHPSIHPSFSFLLFRFASQGPHSIIITIFLLEKKKEEDFFLSYHIVLWRRKQSPENYIKILLSMWLLTVIPLRNLHLNVVEKFGVSSDPRSYVIEGSYLPIFGAQMLKFSLFVYIPLFYWGILALMWVTTVKPERAWLGRTTCLNWMSCCCWTAAVMVYL